MEAVAIQLTKNSMRVVLQTLLSDGARSRFTWAALCLPNQGQKWYYVSVNPANPVRENFSLQILSEEMLAAFFQFVPPAIPELWFPVTLKGK